MKFYICNHCGNIIAYVKSSGVPVVCCGEKMQELVPNTTDAAVEKHVPVIQIDGSKAVSYTHLDVYKRQGFDLFSYRQDIYKKEVIWKKKYWNRRQRCWKR